MLFFKFLKTILFGIAKLLAFCLKIIYNILKLLKIRVLTLYLVICGLVQLIAHAFSGNEVWFFSGLALCGVVTVAAWIFTLSRNKRTKERKKKEQEEQERAQEERPPVAEQPKYYWVEGHENYYFAEYGDRYELFRRTESGDEYIQTDYKER